MRDCFLEDSSLILVIELVSKWCNIFGPIQPIVELPFVIRVFQCGVVAVLYIERKYCSRFGSILYSSLIIVISLQLHGCRQIVEPRKYCLVCVIVFLWRMFSQFFFVSHRLGIRLNSLHHMPHNSFISTTILIQTQARSQFLHRFQPHKKWFFW